MRVILTGAQGTGKTSVMNALPDRYKQFGIKEVIRNMSHQDPSIKINQNSNNESQDKFFFEYLYLFSKYPEYISDRGLLDVCAYTLWLVDIGKCQYYTYEKQLYILQEWINTHPDEIYIYFPIYFPVVDDGYRDTDENNRKDVDRYIQEILNKCVVQYHTISNSPVSNRVEEIIRICENKDNNAHLIDPLSSC